MVRVPPISRCSIAVTSPTPCAGCTALSPTWKSGAGAWGMGGMDPGGPGRIGGLADCVRGGGGGGSTRGGGLLVTRFPFDFAGELEDIGVLAAEARGAAERGRVWGGVGR